MTRVGSSIVYLYLLTCQVPLTEMHYKEKWFHGKLTNGRIDAERLLANYHGENGAFLVRESPTFTGDYSLSFV